MAGRLHPSLSAQFPYDVPTAVDYAEAIAGTFARHFDPGNGPELIVEPGMGVLSDVLWFVCRVVATKVIDDTPHAIISGSIYDLKPTLNKYDMPFEVIPIGVERTEGEWVVSGLTCMEIDVLHRGWQGSLSTGDLLVFSNVGAYTVVLKPPFIEPAPAILSIGPDGSVVEVKRAETLDDVLGLYRS